MSKNLIRRPATATATQEQPKQDRVSFIVSALDQLESVQNQYAAGCVLIGMELLALKKELGHGQFKTTFAEKLERPRFAYRTAVRFMKVAEMLRVKLAAGASVKLGEVLGMALAPSAMGDKERAELAARIGETCEGRTMQQLMLDFQAKPKALPSGQPDDLPEEERKKRDSAYYRMHYNQALTDLIGKLAMITTKRPWAYMTDEETRAHLTHLKAIVGSFPKK